METKGGELIEVGMKAIRQLWSRPSKKFYPKYGSLEYR